MPITQAREIAAASRLDNVRYAIRDLACIADEVIKQGHKVLPLNVGDPNIFDFRTPAHLIEAVYKAMRDGKNGYAPSSGIKEALDAIRGEAERKGISNVQDVFVTTGVSETVDLCLTALLNPGDDLLTPFRIIRCTRRCWPSWELGLTLTISMRKTAGSPISTTSSGRLLRAPAALF